MQNFNIQLNHVNICEISLVDSDHSKFSDECFKPKAEFNSVILEHS